VELLANLLEPPLRDPVMAIVEDGPDAERLTLADGYHQAVERSYEELLAVLLAHRSPTIRSLAAYHVGELGLGELAAELEAAADGDASGFIGTVVERARALLSEPDQPGLGRIGPLPAAAGPGHRP
jgi:hypothetical protein